MWYASVALIFIGFGMLANLLRSEQWPMAVVRRVHALARTPQRDSQAET